MQPDPLSLLRANGPFGLVGLAVAIMATPLVARLARRLDVMDHPDQVLKPHASPVPYLGGLAIALGWTVALVVALLVGGRAGGLLNVGPAGTLLPIVGGGLAMVILGLMDDVGDLPPRLRLIVSAVVVALVMLATGAGAELANCFLAPTGVLVEGGLAYFLSIPIAVFVVLGACNSTNLIDGLDGLCAGVIGVVGLALAVLAASATAVTGGATEAALPPQWAHGAPVLLALSLGGASLGFLFFNYHPAKIFMGDAGSLLLGYGCGMLILLLSQAGELRWLLGAIIAFGLPIFDTALALYRRWRSGKSIFTGDRSHFYDQLVQRGFSVRQTAHICYALAAAYGVAGVSVAWMTNLGALILFFSVAVGTAAVAWALGMTNPQRRGWAERR